MLRKLIRQAPFADYSVRELSIAALEENGIYVSPVTGMRCHLGAILHLKPGMLFGMFKYICIFILYIISGRSKMHLEDKIKYESNKNGIYSNLRRYYLPYIIIFPYLIFCFNGCRRDINTTKFVCSEELSINDNTENIKSLLSDEMKKNNWFFIYSLDNSYIPYIIHKIEKETDRNNKIYLMNALLWIQPRTRESAFAVSRQLLSDDKDIRYHAALTLRKMWPDGLPAIPTISYWIPKENDESVLCEILRCVADYGEDASECVPLLIQVLEEWLPGGLKMKSYRDIDINKLIKYHSRIDTTRYQVIYENILISASHALGMIGKASSPAVPHLIKNIGSTNRCDTSIIDAIGDIGNTEWNRLAISFLFDLFKDRQYNSTAFHAAIAAARIKEDGEPGIWYLSQYLADNKDLDSYEIDLIGRIGPKACKLVPYLIEYLNNSDFNTKLYATQTLLRIEPKNTIYNKDLIKLLDTIEPENKSEVIKVIGDLGYMAIDLMPLIDQIYKNTNKIEINMKYNDQKYISWIKYYSAISLIKIKKDIHKHGRKLNH